MLPIRILLVDDSAGFIASASALLACCSRMQVVGTAHSGPQGVELSGRLAPDLVLMDLVMPGMGGLAATALIKSRPAPPRVAIVTLHDHPEYRRSAHDAGADGFICKSEFAEALPVLVDHLFPTLERAS